jgi:hypothetical protein
VLCWHICFFSFFPRQQNRKGDVTTTTTITRERRDRKGRVLQQRHHHHHTTNHLLLPSLISLIDLVTLYLITRHTLEIAVASGPPTRSDAQQCPSDAGRSSARAHPCPSCWATYRMLWTTSLSRPMRMDISSCQRWESRGRRVM